MINLFMIDINTLPDPRDNTDLLICLPKSKQEKIRKAENVINLQVITSAIVAALLIFARNW